MENPVAELSDSCFETRKQRDYLRLFFSRQSRKVVLFSLGFEPGGGGVLYKLLGGYVPLGL